MKKLLALVFVLALATMAPAAVKDCGFFTADLPEGWTLQEINKNVSALVAPDKTLGFSVSSMDAEGHKLAEIANALCAQHQGTDFAKMEGEGEAYEYKAVVNGAPTYVQIFELGEDKMGVISISGDHESDLATEIFNSIEFK